MSNVQTTKSNVLSAERIHSVLSKNIPREMDYSINRELITPELIEKSRAEMEGVKVEFIPHDGKTLVVSVYDTVEHFQRDVNRPESAGLIAEKLLVINEEELSVTCLVNDESLANFKYLLGLIAE